MTKARQDSLYLLFLGSAIFLLLGFTLEIFAPHPLSDFKFVYNSARCLFQHADPYQRSEFLRVFLADGGNLGSGTTHAQYLEMAQHMYPPTSFILSPFAFFGWETALGLWSILIACTFVLASFLVWDLGAGCAPVLSALMIFMILSSSQLLLIIGNAAGLVVSLSVIAAYCFLQNRFVALGILCCTISLMIKPHDGGLVWLYFLLAGGLYRKRALQTLGVTLALSVPIVVWVSAIAPHWYGELRSNLAMLSAHGHLNDPGPSSMAGHGIAMVIDLQSVISTFWDNPHFYNAVSYIICGVLLAVWIMVTVRTRPSPAMAWLALASISALSMLPLYHRLGDAKLLLLTIPACAMLWAEGGWIGWLAVAVTGTAIFLSGDLQWAMFFRLLSHVELSQSWLSGRLLMVLQVFPVPLALLTTCVFYLLVYVRRGLKPVQLKVQGEQDKAGVAMEQLNPVNSIEKQ
jgi:hypothetical protein